MKRSKPSLFHQPRRCPPLIPNFGLADDDDATNIYEEFIKSVKALRDANGKQLEVNVNPVLKVKESLENRNIDGDWLFEESFSEQNLERYYGVSKKAQIEQKEAIDQCGRLRQKLIKKIGFDPSRYFAVIVLDGDGMGQTISQAEDWESHTEISSKLNEYTTKVRQIVDGDYLGKLIYAGGDGCTRIGKPWRLVENPLSASMGFPKPKWTGESSLNSIRRCLYRPL